MIYITTAIDYPNADPHLGHAYERIIGDCIARWHKLSGEDVFFLVGTDEHGQKVQKAAITAGKTPQKFVDEKSLVFKKLCTALNISYSRFIRTTDADHVHAAQTIFQKVLDKGDIYLGAYEGLYCVGCEAFYLEKDAPNNECPTHKKKLEEVKEPSYFFRLSTYEKEIKKLLETPGFVVPEFRAEELRNRMKDGLKDISVSRVSFTWGIPLPNDNTHVMYVWFDALLNYISGIGYPAPQYKKYWPGVNLIGKDIAWFHAVIWPAMLISAGVKPPACVLTHGFINIDGEKLSKTRGITVDPILLVETYGADAVRYFLLSQIPAGQDGDFSEEALIRIANADLGDSIGNLLQRVVTLLHKSCNGNIPGISQEHVRTPNTEDNALITASAIYDDMNQHMKNYEWHKAIERLMQFVRHVNKYITAQQPWKVSNKHRLEIILYCAVESLRIISICAQPFIPSSSQHIREQLGQNEGISAKDAVFRQTTTGIVQQPRVLFTKIGIENKNTIKSEVNTAVKNTIKNSANTIAQTNTRPLSQNQFSILNLNIGIIQSATHHPSADRLLVLQVDLGTEQRTICAGIKQWYAPHELIGKHVCIVTNLKPATFRGITSQGMMLAGEKDGMVRVLEAPNAPAGTPVLIPEATSDSKQMKNLTPQATGHFQQITIEEFATIKLEVANQHVYHNKKNLIAGEQPITVNLPDGSTIR